MPNVNVNWLAKTADGKAVATGVLYNVVDGDNIIHFRDQESGLTRDIPVELVSTIDISVEHWDENSEGCINSPIVTLTLREGQKMKGCSIYEWQIKSPDGIITSLSNGTKAVTVERAM
jgi:hypothetical protein